jgi:cysteine desulfurase / selenocysteine lyase
MNTARMESLPLPLDVDRLRADFPILGTTVHGKPLAYLDNGASAQRPAAVLDAERYYAEHLHANVHRGVHHLSQVATEAFEGARAKVRRFLNARSEREIIFTRGTTEAINLVAQSYARPKLGPGDEIIVSRLEHHANIVPWQMVCQQTGARLVVAPITHAGELDLEALAGLFSPRTRLLAITHVSNALGTVFPVRACIELAHARGVPVLLDGAQAVPHIAVDVQSLDCDFYAFSGHKLYGPTGIGILYGREELLRAMPPWQGGGDMILAVTFEQTTYNELPAKFEAGTPNIGGAVGLGAAIDYVQSIGLERIAAWEHELLLHATRQLAAIEGLTIIGTARDKASLVSFVVDGVHPHDLGTILDQEGIAIRTGHHCAMPVMDFYGLPATARASFAFYNTKAEIDRLAAAVISASKLLR